MHQIMGLRTAVEVFDDWAIKGKDVGMEQGHSEAVKEMLSFVFDKMEEREKTFSAIDVGCGNGWVVRHFQENPLCEFAVGIDGSNTMIEKAHQIDPEGNYRIALLPDFMPDSQFDIVHSMEFLYYLQEPETLLKNIHDSWLKSDGWLIVGIDHYLENEDSLTWPEKVGVFMNTKSEDEWKTLWNECGFDSIISWKANVTSDSAGTLVIAGKKEN